MLREFSAGGVVFKKKGKKIWWLVRRGAYNPKYPGSSEWSLPKGWIDDAEGGRKPGPMASGKTRATREKLEAAAVREVEEEGGVRVRVEGKLGDVKFAFANDKGERVFKVVTFFLMEYTGEVEGGFGEETEEVKWVGLDEAKELLTKRRGEWEMVGKGERYVCCM